MFDTTIAKIIELMDQPPAVVLANDDITVLTWEDDAGRASVRSTRFYGHLGVQIENLTDPTPETAVRALAVVGYCALNEIDWRGGKWEGLAEYIHMDVPPGLYPYTWGGYDGDDFHRAEQAKLIVDMLPRPFVTETQEEANKRYCGALRRYGEPMPAKGTILGDWYWTQSVST